MLEANESLGQDEAIPRPRSRPDILDAKPSAVHHRQHGSADLL